MEKHHKETINLAYVLWQFPTLSETFILNEMLFLKKYLLNSEFNVYSIKKSHDKKAHKLVEDFMHSDIYIPNLISLRFVSTVLFFFIKRPLKIFAITFKLLKEVPVKISWRLSMYYIVQLKYSLLKGIYVADVLKKKNVVHVHTHFSETSALIIRIAAFLSDIPYSLTTHAHDLYQNPNKVLIVNLIRNSKFSVTISEYNKRYLLSLDGTLAKKIHIIHCGVNLERFVPKYKRNGKVFNILTVARLVGTKGVKETIEACALLPENINYKYNIVGAGPQYDELLELIHAKNLVGKIKLTGAKRQDEVLELMQKSDLFVLYCKIAEDGNRDGIPVALMESMAMQLPVISTRISGIPELIKDGSGIIVEEGDEAGLFEGILEIALMSSEQRKKKGKIGREIIRQEFNLETEVNKLASLYLDK